jgi:ankyrin repeat protein
MVPLLSVVSQAASNDLRVVEAVQKRDKLAVRSLLRQHADVNSPQTDGSTALAWAVHWDDLEAAELLLRAGANVNAANDLGITALSLACTNSNAAMVDKLLKAGANLNAATWSGETALMTCAGTGNVNAVKSLIAHGADVNAKETRRGQTALMWAVSERHSEVARELIESGADIHARSKSGFTPLLFAARHDDLESARMLLAAGANVNEGTPQDGNALVVASTSGHEALSLFLLDKGSDPNAADSNGMTALHYAVLKGLSIVLGARNTPLELNPDDDTAVSYGFRPNMLELVKALLAHGGDPNARILKQNPQLPFSNMSLDTPVGATPLLLAAATGDVSVIRVLAAAGADPLMATVENTTPLMVAAGMARFKEDRTNKQNERALEAIKVLVELGADANAVGENGWTALHAAAYAGADETIKFLVEKGAKIDVMDKLGQTPLSIAEGVLTVGMADRPDRRVREANVKPRKFRKSTSELLLKLGATPLDASGVQRREVLPPNLNQ